MLISSIIRMLISSIMLMLSISILVDIFIATTILQISIQIWIRVITEESDASTPAWTAQKAMSAMKPSTVSSPNMA